MRPSFRARDAFGVCVHAYVRVCMCKIFARCHMYFKATHEAALHASLFQFGFWGLTFVGFTVTRQAMYNSQAQQPQQPQQHDVRVPVCLYMCMYLCMYLCLYLCVCADVSGREAAALAWPLPMQALLIIS